ncbi:RNA-dependent ATPase [Exophiala dermatitidis]|uniref:RNA helicase n=2 Tax=Exophiala dermatitidis TaxID=5970 RepID=H6C3N4_EXODN|nr:ATP-dependent RNA helicase [Exophiala dermatitidis NIH/UT8656]KAJ4513942.1 RNA-dependent ATPase [Exophiala dermatitidis]EHY58249.1 ATP-dependent RNA helicase [Exophiala dermatitidis NIH/UT8656]KAJ4517192.1 RNA-dependent ATPase [Exophiala dermatitidis]KAJ4519630.1 RNA-dependent ATPase [Exophiala dermatitidis]KAJ4534570.1 RNA-dependent ATPase [Exophiala dermatitidis]
MSKHKLDDPEAQLAKQEKKRRRKEEKNRKEASRLQDITPSSTDATAQSTPAPENTNETADDGDTYKPDSSLDALPQTAVDEFLKSESVQIEDPKKSDLRPILAFTQLPSNLKTQFSSVFSSFEKPSSIQSAAWPFLLSGRDVVGVAETGSGKTIAFGMPLIFRLSGLKKKKGIRAVVVAPTRELAIQVFEQIDKLCKTATSAGQKLKPVCIYGGTNKDEQRRSLQGANIVVATPGRLKDFMSDGTIDVSKTRYLVLDEADRMLDKGFEDDIKHIISQMPSSSKRQTAMFTATWPKSIRDLAATFMKEPVKITIGRNDADDSGELRANTRIVQKIEVMDGSDKQNRLLQLLREHTAGKKRNDRILVFCLYKKEALRIENFIRSRGFNVAGIHGDMSQSARIASLEAFKSGSVSLLVATDVAARGLDIPEVKLVINVTFPLTAEDYVHRIGRTGRAGKEGLAITMFTEQDKALAGALVNVLRAAKQDVPEDLLRFGTTVKKKQHDAYGAFYREAEEGKKATKITFD